MRRCYCKFCKPSAGKVVVSISLDNDLLPEIKRLQEKHKLSFAVLIRHVLAFSLGDISYSDVFKIVPRLASALS